MKKEVPSKEYVYEQLRGIEMSPTARSIIKCMVDGAWFDYCIIIKQLTEALSLPKALVEKSLKELIDIGVVKQNALYGKERTYIVNSQFFTSKRPQRRSREELLAILKVHTSS